MEPQSFWLALNPEQKVSLMNVAGGKENPTAVAHWEKIPDAVREYLQERPAFTAEMIPAWKAPVKNMRTIFVVVGHPCQKPPANFIQAELNVEIGQERMMAKKFRIEASKDLSNFNMGNLQGVIRFNPADFYYAVFENPVDLYPMKDSSGELYIASDNYFTRRK